MRNLGVSLRSRLVRIVSFCSRKQLTESYLMSRRRRWKYSREKPESLCVSWVVSLSIRLTNLCVYMTHLHSWQSHQTNLTNNYSFLQAHFYKLKNLVANQVPSSFVLHHVQDTLSTCSVYKQALVGNNKINWAGTKHAYLLYGCSDCQLCRWVI